MTDNPTTDDGGPAFPGKRLVQVMDKGTKDTSFINTSCPGMSLRDYFAIHSDQPGVTEIVATAGLTVENNYWVIRPGEDKLSFNEWWGSLSQDERFKLYAKVRYTAADAMLKEREGRS